MDKNPSQIGIITELKCQIWLIEQGYNICIPIGNYQKYDIVIEKNNKFYKIQCKHASETKNGFMVRTKFQKRQNGKVIKKKYTPNDIDFFMTEFKGKYYLFPPFETQETKFWTVPSRLKNASKQAQNFKAEDVLNKL